MSRVATCHLYLTKRDRCAYGIAKCPWPPRTRPFQVVRLVDESFEPRGTPATLAYADPAGDAWIVTRFSWCGVEMSGPPDSRVAELLKEGFAAMTAGFGELKGTAAETLRHVVAMRPHVEGVPPLVERAQEALADPIAAADDIRRLVGLTPREQEVRDAVIAEGTQKKAAKALRTSEATLSRIVAQIRQKFVRAGIPHPFLRRPSAGYQRHVRSPERPHAEPQEDIEAPVHDWRRDPAERVSTIRRYLQPSLSEQQREEMRAYYSDIAAEAAKYSTRGGGVK